MFDFATAEYSAVGCFLIDSRCLPTIRERISTPEAFASEPCRKAFTAACKLADNGKPVDPVTVGREAGLDNAFLVDCMNTVPSCNGAEAYAQTVTEGFRRRQLRELGDKLQADSLSLGADTTQLLADARAALDGLSETSGSNAASSSFDSLRDFLGFRAEVNEGKLQAVKTGFPSLDGILGGFARGGLYVIAARPGVGKSALGIALADMIARETTVLYASLEMSGEELNSRRVAAFSTAPCIILLRFFVFLDVLPHFLLYGIAVYAFQYFKFIRADVRFNRRNIFGWVVNHNSLCEVNAAFIGLICPDLMLMVNIGAHGDCPQNAIN